MISFGEWQNEDLQNWLIDNSVTRGAQSEPVNVAQWNKKHVKAQILPFKMRYCATQYDNFSLNYINLKKCKFYTKWWTMI